MGLQRGTNSVAHDKGKVHSRGGGANNGPLLSLKATALAGTGTSKKSKRGGVLRGDLRPKEVARLPQ